MNAIQNAGGHVGLTARNYPIAAATDIKAGQVVKLSAGLVVSAAAAETGAILGIAAESHTGVADCLNPRNNGEEIKVFDNPELIFECPAPVFAAASGSATTIVPASGAVDAAAADDAFNGSVAVLIEKAAGSTNTDPVGKRITITDYAKSGTVLTKESGGTPYAGDVYEFYPAIGSAVCALSTKRKNAVVTAAGASALRVIGHDPARHCIRLMAAKHQNGNTVS